MAPSKTPKGRGKASKKTNLFTIQVPTLTKEQQQELKKVFGAMQITIVGPKRASGILQAYPITKKR